MTFTKKKEKFFFSFLRIHKQISKIDFSNDYQILDLIAKLQRLNCHNEKSSSPNFF